MVESAALTTLEAIVTTTGVLAGLLLVVLASPLDSVRHRRDELLYDSYMLNRYSQWRQYDDRMKEVLDPAPGNTSVPLSELKEKLERMKDNHKYIKKIHILNKYTLTLLVVIVSLFSISLMMIALGDTTDRWIIDILSVATIFTFIAIIPLSSIDDKGHQF